MTPSNTFKAICTFKASANPFADGRRRALFRRCFAQVRPALGQAEVELEKLTRNGLFDYGPESYRIKANALSFIQQLKSSSRTDSLSVLLEGPQGSGKTAVAAAVALNSEFPFVKVVSTASLIGYARAPAVRHHRHPLVPCSSISS